MLSWVVTYTSLGIGYELMYSKNVPAWIGCVSLVAFGAIIILKRYLAIHNVSTAIKQKQRGFQSEKIIKETVIKEIVFIRCVFHGIILGEV